MTTHAEDLGEKLEQLAGEAEGCGDRRLRRLAAAAQRGDGRALEELTRLGYLND